MSESSQSVAEALKSFFQAAADPVMFTGAGVSMLAGLPDWKGLLSQMAESVRAKDALTANMMTQLIAKGSLTKAAEYFWLSGEVPDGDKNKTLKSILGSYDAAPLLPLASLPVNSVLTTNFDRSIIDAIVTARKQAPRDYRLGDSIFSGAVWETELYVARIHGCIEAPNRMVLSDSQFNVMLSDEVYIDLLTQTFLRKPVLFLGFSFYDPAIKFVLESIEKRYGPAAPGRHMAVLPDSNASDLIHKANRLNITVVQYDSADRHKALWDGITEFSRSLKKEKLRPVVSSEHPYAAAKQYLAACYARVSVASECTPLREIVIEGIISASLQGSHPKSLGLPDLHESVRKALGIKGTEVNALVDGAVKQLVDAKLVRRHKVESEKGKRFAWIGEPEGASSLGDAIKTLVTSLCNRAYVQEGWRPPQHVSDVMESFLKEIVYRRGWDLGAAFASGKAPDNVAFRPVLLEVGGRLSAFDRERVERTVESLFQRPTEQEGALLGELGRVSFAVELAFQAPRSTLLHKTTLPRRLYFDTNLLLPIFAEGHPHHRTYRNTLRALKAASTGAGNSLQLVAYSGYVNEMINHKAAALAYAREAGDDFDALARSDAMYHGAGNINVYIGAYVNMAANGQASDFDSFIKRVAPYSNETELRRWIEKQGFIVVNSAKNAAYTKLYGLLERSNATRLEFGKQPILIEHDALQLALLDADCRKGERALFVTADRALYEGISSSDFGRLAEFMVSHVGIVQIVDLLVGSKGDERALGELLWSNKVSEKAQRVRSYLTIEALTKYDAALAMDMHSVVEAQSEAIAKELERIGADLESHEPKTRVKAFRSLGSLEANFFAGMSEAIDKQRKR